MPLQNTYIPYRGYWTTPFVKWQGSFANLHPLTFAAEVGRRALAERNIDAGVFDGLHLGMTVPALQSFYGASWVAGLIGAGGVSGPTVNQACATSARVVGGASFEIEAGAADTILCLTADRTSNGPHLTYPNPANSGGKPDAEDWVWDNFSCDPWAGGAMLGTAENVAARESFSTEEQHDVVLLRHAQYARALADDAAFHRRYMVTPIEIKNARGRVTATITDDEGIFPTTKDGLARLTPVLAGGTVTYGGQTYPADGSAALILANRERAQTLSADAKIEIQVLGFGQARVEKAHMPMAPVPAAQKALAAAGITIEQVKAIKTHNPFAVNDLYFARHMGVSLEAMNNYGCSLIWGHPQGPTGMRLIIELVEELVLLGGGYGLFTGCAAGDTGAAIVVRVGDAAS